MLLKRPHMEIGIQSFFPTYKRGMNIWSQDKGSAVIPSVTIVIHGAWSCIFYACYLPWNDQNVVCMPINPLSLRRNGFTTAQLDHRLSKSLLSGPAYVLSFNSWPRTLVAGLVNTFVSSREANIMLYFLHAASFLTFWEREKPWNFRLCNWFVPRFWTEKSTLRTMISKRHALWRSLI